MKKMNLICIFFIFLILCIKIKNNETEFDLEDFIEDLINSLKGDKIVIENFEKLWNTIPYKSKNIFYQHIPLIKKKCLEKKLPYTCKILFDILGIL
jgi:hypothetical protein